MEFAFRQDEPLLQLPQDDVELARCLVDPARRNDREASEPHAHWFVGNERRICFCHGRPRKDTYHDGST
jgi:hypothetical protein